MKIENINANFVHGYRKQIGENLFAEIIRAYANDWFAVISDKFGNVKANPLDLKISDKLTYAKAKKWIYSFSLKS